MSRGERNQRARGISAFAHVALTADRRRHLVVGRNGHAPFGHKGEHALDRLMKAHGGFEHNRQSLRIVEELERKYPHFSGLNLSWEVREGLAKHQTGFDVPPGGMAFPHRQASLEAQIANLADEIAYYSHDLDDGLDSALLDEKRLRVEVKIWAGASRQVKRRFGEAASAR